MPVEIEAKMKVDDLSVVRERLRAAGARAAGVVLETNTFYDTDDRSLLAADKGLRLRQSRDAGTGASEFVITYKGPRMHGPLKSRDELEVRVDDGPAGGALLEALGYHTVLAFEKRRETWELGGCKVELDELPHLGVFVEIEGPGEDAVMKVRDTLKLGDRPLVRASYIAMLMTHLQETGARERVVTFPVAG
jgi:adenylate cyclase class 2